MTTALHHLILERLLADEQVPEAAVNLVDAACTSESALQKALAQLHESAPAPTRGDLAHAHVDPSGVYLSKLQVAGFRGVGPAHTLEINPGPGLTLLIGRNGSGKSSFAEGLETLLTNKTQRWAGRAKEWKDGWKNLHTEHGSFVEATFAVERGDAVVLRRVWTAGNELEESELRVRRGTEKLNSLEELGWADALSSFRPFLSYAELGALLNRPSELYDSLKGILGLEELGAAIKRLTAARKLFDDREKRVKDDSKRLQQQLDQLPEDPRAKRCRDALKPRSWRLAEIEEVIAGRHDDDPDHTVALLRSLAQLPVPTIDAVATAVSALRDAIGAQAELAGTSDEHNAGLARLLEQALQHCRVADKECPVCGGTLPVDWASTARSRLKQANELATKASALARERAKCVERLRGLIRSVPSELERAEQVGLSTQLSAAWRAWSAAPAEPAALCDHAEAAVLDLHAAHTPFVEQARHKLDALQSAWRPVERALTEWLAAAKAVEAEAATLKALESAENWLKEAEEEIRDARFAPLALKSQKIWAALRQQSSVNLANIKLEGKGTTRRVELNVSVDGRDGVALSVMSQGELNALALSLFLPRMMSAESPFRFLIIDDPVQAMDSHKVDGLARVLDDAAKSRQVIVLTHDTRLLEAVRRLKIDATVLGVQRRADSVIDIQVQLDAVERHLRDARDIAFNEQKLGPKIAARMVPGFCRLAVEAACVEAIRRRRLARGDLFDDVERTIENVRGLHELAALALFDDTTRSGEVYKYLNNKLQHQAGDAFRDLKEGAHGSFTGSTRDLISDSRKIADMLRAHS